MAKRRSKSSKSSRRKSTQADEASLFDGSSSNGEAGGELTNFEGELPVALHEVARTRYLNYALSVITSRALPDVRDGLKPVQRRILFTMWQQRLTSDAKHRKCAKVVGDVMGNYHPHGDSAIYETLVRMAQSFSMRVPLIDGSGNFGSLDGDGAAAMRYTECRLAPIATELLEEIGQNTVHFRPNYDGTKSEPVVLPARLPNLLLNGSMGIAVGMATNIPPHNLSELINACVKLLDNPELKAYQLVANDAVQGPDFPTGGQVLNTREELREIYKTGSGSVRVRSTWELGPITRNGKTVYITSVPYTVNKANLVERVAELVINRKLPQLLDVKDISTDDVRVELTLKRDADEQKVLAYLFKHTPMQTNFAVNLTCLLPTENPEVCRPERCDIRVILQSFLNFRLDVVTNRLKNELEALEKRIHILEGFALVFDALDEIIAIIRKSEGKADAARKIMARFKELDEEQTDAILELKLYRLARLEINIVRDELKDKQTRAKQIRKLLADETGRWGLVREELIDIKKKYGKDDPRRSIIEAPEDEPEISEEDFIVDEESHVLVTRDGWVKRQKEIKDPANTRLREGDSILAVFAGSTRSTCVFFSNLGVAYTARIADITATTGFGNPVQKLFKLKDGEHIVAAMSLDPRVSGNITAPDEDHSPESHAIAVASDGNALRFGLDAFVEPSTRAGRRYARMSKGHEIVGVENIHGLETIIAVSQQARAMLCSAEEINYLAGPGKGVRLIKLASDDRVLGFKASQGERDLLKVKTSRGATQTISTAKYKVTGRGGKGIVVMKTGSFSAIEHEEPTAPVMLDE